MKKIFIVFSLFLLIGCTDLNIQVYDETYYQLNNDGLKAYEQGDYDTAINLLKDAIEHDPETGTAYNSLGVIYNDLEQYDEAILVLNKAIEYAFESSEAYTNLGHAHHGLQQNEEAKHAYLLSLSKENDNPSVHFALGTIYEEMSSYNQAIKHYNWAIKLDDDVTYKTTKLECMIDFGQYIDAYTYADEAIQSTPDNYRLYALKGQILETIGSPNEIIHYYQTVEKKFPHHEEALLNTGIYHYYQGNYEAAESIFHQHQTFKNGQLWLGYTYNQLGKYDSAKTIAEDIILNYPKDYAGYHLMGNILSDETDHLKAADYFDKALLYAESDISAVKMIASLSAGLRYQQAIEKGLELLKEYPMSRDLYYEIIMAYYNKSDYENTIKYTKDYHELFQDDTTYYLLAWCYYYLNDFNASLEAIEHYLKFEPKNEDVLNLKTSITSETSSKIEHIEGYFKDYYLYEYNQDAFSSFKDPLTDEDISALIETAKLNSDPYTHVFTNSHYETLKHHSSRLIIRELSNNKIYFKFQSFDETIDDDIIEAIDNIPDPENTILILDLRDNTGGSTLSANNILNVLLPDLLVSQFIYRDGYFESYYSDKSMIAFKHIYILVNENTISASELLTLGLKTYLNNVTIIGQQTYGKGVGQDVFYDEVNKRIYYIVSHYWNVRERNISNIGIAPDIYVHSNDLKDYFNQIN